MNIARHWLEDFFAPPGPPLDDARTGTLSDVDTTWQGRNMPGVRFSAAPGATVTGLTGGDAGRKLTIVAAGGAIVLANENAASVAVNRIVTGAGDVTIPSGGAMLLEYDGTTQRWRILGSPGGGEGSWDPDAAETLTNKTLSLDDNTLIATSGASGDLVRHDGTKFARMSRGAANTVLKSNSSGTGTSFGLLTNANFDDAAAIAGSKIAAATTSDPGAMAAADKAKLDGMQKQGGSVAVAAMDIDWSLGGVFVKTLAVGSNAFTFSNATDGWLITVIVTSDAGGSTLSWPSGVYWTGGAEPIQTEMGGTDVYTFVKAGANIYGSVVQGLEASA